MMRAGFRKLILRKRPVDDVGRRNFQVVNAEFQPEAVVSSEIETLLNKTTITTRDTEYFDKLCIPGEEDVVTVVTRDSNGIQAGTDIPYGAPPRLADTDTVRAKFMDCARSRVSDERAAKIFDVVMDVDGKTGFAELQELMATARA